MPVDVRRIAGSGGDAFVVAGHLIMCVVWPHFLHLDNI